MDLSKLAFIPSSIALDALVVGTSDLKYLRLTDYNEVDPGVLRPEAVGSLADVDAGVVQGHLLDLQRLLDSPESGRSGAHWYQR